MRGLLLPLAQLDADAVEAWRSLATRAAEPNPFFEADFTLAAARHLGQRDVAALVAVEGDEWRGCLPVRTGRAWRRLPGRWLVAWRHVYAFLGTPLLEVGRERPALEAMLGALDAGGPRVLAVEWLRRGGPVAAALEAVCGARGGGCDLYDSFERAGIERRPEATYLDALSSGRRKELRRLARRLDEDLGAATATVDRAGDAEAVERFLALEASGWKGRARTAMACERGHADFFREVCTSLAGADRLELLALEGGERTLAMQCNLFAGECVFSFKVAHDEEYARYSPGVQLELAAVKRFHAHDDAVRMDSCADPDNELINRLWPDRVQLATFTVPTGPSRLRPVLRGVLAAHRGVGARRARATKGTGR